MSNVKSLPQTLPLNKTHSFKRQRPSQNEQFREVADLYEKQFLREMLKQMRATVDESGFLKKNMAEKIFQGELDNEYVDVWGDQGGIGLSNLIYDQLQEKFGNHLRREGKPKGPIPIDEKKPVQMRKLNEDPKTVTFELMQKGAALSQPKLQAPWSGVIEQMGQINDEQSYLKLSHKNGLQSTLVFSGINQIEKGDSVSIGQDLATIHSVQSPLVWTIQKTG